MEKNEEDLQMKRNLILQELERMDGGGVGRGLWNDNDSKMEDGQIDSPVVRAEISNGCPYKRSRLSEDNRDNEERTSQTESPYSHSNGYEDSDRDESPNGEEMDSIENELENNLDEKPVFKTVLEEVDNDPFLSLPAGWRRLTHNSGLHLYLHGKERVVTFSRPYFIGPDSVRNHAVPVSAIPCLQQKRKKKLVEEQKQEECISHENPMIASIQSKKPTIETYEDSQLNPTSLTEYCDGLFSFKQIRVRKYQNFKEKKLEKQALKTDQMLRDAGASIEDLKDDEMATVTSSGVALINIPTQDKRFHKKTFVMNPTGKTSIQILHEYVQRALKGRLECMEKDTANTTQPYSATYKLHLKKAIRIQLASGITEKLEILHSKGDDVEGEDVLVLGTGYGSRKKNAKLEAAEKAVNLLIPSITFDQEHIASLQTNGPQVNYNVKATEIFDKIEVTDKRVFDLCNRSGVAAPYRCLKEACQRRGELQGEEPQITSFPAGDRQTEVVLTLRDITVSAKANGAKIAKQYAAQQLLQKLHPLVQHYGTILRMYDSAQEKHLRKENSRNHDEVISLQNKGSKAEPNKAIVEKLRAEMMAIPRGDISRRIGAKRASPSVNPY